MNALRTGWRTVVGGLMLGVVAAASASGQWQPATTLKAPASADSAPARQVVIAGSEQLVRLPNSQTLVLSADGSAVSLHGDTPSKVLRSWPIPDERLHATLTMLPSGRVLLWGGQDKKGRLQPGGLMFDPELRTLQLLTELSLAARAHHTATVLTDGRVLFAGGHSEGAPYQVWDESSDVVTEPVAGTFSVRRGHRGQLQADGKVRLFGGVSTLRDEGALLFDPATSGFSRSNVQANSEPVPGVAASIPAQGAQHVSATARLALRFTQRIRSGDLDATSVTLIGPGGATPIVVVPAEQGRLVFISPTQELFPNSAYTVLVKGVQTIKDEPLPLIAVDFRTAALPEPSSDANAVTESSSPPAPAASSTPSRTYCKGTSTQVQPCHARASLKDGVWTPGMDSTGERWRVQGRQPELVSTEIMSRVTAAVGFTTLIGEVRRVDGTPVANVEVSVGTLRALTDTKGQFTLYQVPAGRQEVYVDGTTANAPGVEYGQFVVGVDVEAGRLTQLPYTMYLPRITERDKLRIPSPTTRDTVLTHPDMPGLMVQIPAGTVIRDRKGRIVRELAIVPTPVNRAPFPVADNYPMYFTLEPGGAVIQGLTPEAAKGVRVFYPNYDKHPAGTQANFWIYDPVEGWRVYGKGRVTTNGKVFSPEAGVALHQTMGGSYSINSSDAPPEDDMPPDCQQCGESNAGTGSNATAGDPIDLRTGRFSYAENDISIQDVIPLVLGRNYRPNDRTKRDFGWGTSSTFYYRLHVVPGTTAGTVALVLPNGVGLYFQRESGSGYQGVWRHYGTTNSSGAKMEFLSGQGYRITMPDGSAMQFGPYSPNPLNWIQDRYGNRTEFVLDAGLVTQIISPSGRWIKLDRDNQNRINEAWDSLGNTWRYQYNTQGMLAKVIYPDETERQYQYKTVAMLNNVTHHWVSRITDRRGNDLLVNEIDDDIINDPLNFGRVRKQTLADGAVYEIDYFHSDGSSNGVLVTHPDGSQRRVVFDPNSKYPLSDTLAYGTSLAQTFSFERDNYGRMTARVDPLGRRTEYSHNGIGQITGMTHLAGTPQAISASVAYNADNQPTSVTDAMGRATVMQYENGCLVRIVNPLGKHTNLTCNSAGQPNSMTDALNQTTSLHYLGYDLAAVTDPLGRSVQFHHDALGRVVATKDAQGNLTRREYDAEGRLVKAYDAQNRVTELAYDPNGNISAVLMPHGNGITYEYDSRDRLIERTDSLGQSESWAYDSMNRVTSYTDRKGQTTTFTYDALGRPATTIYHDSSAVTATYDAGDRLLSLTDTASGTLGWVFDDLDRVIQAISPQGNISYEYDAAGRRTAMTAASQPRIEYQYDVGDRLRRILQGSEVYEFEYDDLDRLIEQTLPNGIQTGYAYNAASQLTGIAWLKPDTTLLHDMGYGYNSVGQRVVQTGSLAPQLLPAASTGNAFDDNNRQTSHNSQALTYDANGNLTGDGTHTYHWNARDQLVEIKQGSTTIASFGYDVMGRRYTKTEASTTVEYLHDGLDPVQETRGAAIEPILTGLGIDERHARGFGANRHYFLTDGLGSTRLLTDSNGAVVNRYEYDPYGGTTQTNPSVQNGYRYTGREQDANGLYYYRARYYHAGMGRFISEDPLHLAAGDSNVYAYVLGDPLSFTDPTGEFAIPGMIIGAALNLGIQLAMNGGDWNCINWLQVGVSGALGAVGGGALGGAFRHSKSGKSWLSSSHRWGSASERTRRAQNVKSGDELHHWLIERNSPIGKIVPDAIKNHPWNLNPVSQSAHKTLHRMDPVSRTIAGAPTWAQAGGASLGGGAAAQAGMGGGCGCSN